MNALSAEHICAVDSADLTAAIRDYGTSKEVARVVGCSEATAARYRRGETMPDAVGLARLMGRSHRIAQAMLRLAGLDDLSMELEEARLREELQRFQAQRAGLPDVETDSAPGAAARPVVGVRGRLARAADDHALRKMAAALDDAKRQREKL
jgi:transcriptional regulator with XRE-family HTH domain